MSSWNTSNGKFLVAIGNKSELSDASLHFSLFSEKGTWLKGVRMSTMVSPNHPALVGCGSNLYLFYRSADGTIHSRVARDHDRLLWTLPATNNKEGQWKALSLTPELQPVTGIEVRVQDNYGVIDARVLYDGGESSNWTTNNTDQTRVFQCQREKDPITKVVVKEQSGYGVIDLKFTTRSGYESKWLVGNSATGNHTLLEITDQCVMVGLQGKEQGTRGLIDLRLAKKIVA